MSSFISTFVQDMENIKQVWELTKEWETNWESWKIGKFIDLETAEMENVSVSLFKQLAKFSRSLKVQNKNCLTLI